MAEHSLVAPESKAQAAAESVGPEMDTESLKEPLSSLSIQCKLVVGSADDPLEQEADHMADTVMRMPDLSANQSNTVQRKAGHSEDDEMAQRRPLGSFIQKKEAESRQTAGNSVSDRISETKGSGGSMNESTRSFMEHRFGTDFSNVNIHTGGYAAQLSNDLNAQAFTIGNNIYFNEGRYSPESAEGKHLLAHELTHTLQQTNSANRKIQRREIDPGLWWRLSHARQPQDWYMADRIEWQDASVGGYIAGLSQSNTFILATIYNTHNLLPGEYQNVEQRHDYYDIISYVIANDPNTPAAIRDIRFFDATTLVTGSPGIGSVDSPAGAVMLMQQSRIILREVNAELFALNMRIIRDLLFNWQEPRHPTNPQGAITPFDFDMLMVDTEQSTVEQYISRNRSRFTPEVIADINDTLVPTGLGRFNPESTMFQWAMQALSVSALDFTVLAHRVAIGRAAVHIFHRRSLQDYLTYMQQHPIVQPQAGTGATGATPGGTGSTTAPPVAR
ncbi:eCIS core domain-containing protein [Taibaiella soli]|uniref:eCIS core domain-containing protein n=1 Tax=Taibaiella soli TaxID=1649169 RepID=A0A2W2AM48_9BACT|nr:DUF4157 domain-containing protein [Taibaiella soli]PZF73380.1 hypothetical protein DN068_08290 [Taibaiella soli]